MFCKVCAAEFEGTQDICPQCSAAENSAPVKKSNKMLISIIAIVLAAAIAAGIFLVPRFFGGNKNDNNSAGVAADNYEDVAVGYARAFAEGDLIKASEYSVTSYVEVYNEYVEYSCEEYEMTKEEFFQVISEEYNETVTSVEQLMEFTREEAETYLMEEYGNYTISAEVKESAKMSEEELAELIEYIEEDQGYDYPSVFMGVDVQKITEAYLVSVDLTITGTENTDTETQEVTVIKYDGSWKSIAE